MSGLADANEAPTARSPGRSRWAFSVLVSIGCINGTQPSPPGRAARRPAAVDASAHVDASPPSDAPRDAAVRADAGGATPSDFAIIYRGVDWIRVGASVPVQVLRTDAWDVDITAQARLRLEPPDRGEITPDGSFHALGLGRVAIIAEVGGRQETGIIEVSNELPVGTPMLPMIRANNGLVPVHLGLDRAPDGRISMDFGFINHWLVVSGRPLGRTFPMTVPIVRTTPGVRFDPHRGPEAVLPVTGTLVFDRWRLRRLDGHLTARAGTLSLQVTFSMLLADPQTLTAPPATEPVAGQRLTP